MNFSVSALAAGFVFGIFGFYIFKHGRRDAHIPSVVIGILLMVYPYFVQNVWALWGVGAGLCFLAYKLASY